MGIIRGLALAILVLAPRLANCRSRSGGMPVSSGPVVIAPVGTKMWSRSETSEAMRHARVGQIRPALWGLGERGNLYKGVCMLRFAMEERQYVTWWLILLASMYGRVGLISGRIEVCGSRSCLSSE
jgi:hypothetical protein